MKAYCIHPSDDQVREEFMRKSVAGHDIQLEFVLEGDMKDLSDDVLNTYFEGGMCKVHPITSCTYKHFLAYRALLNSGDKVAMVLENDIEFYPNYDSVMDGVLREISERNLSNFLISLEDSQMRYIPKSKRIK